MKYKGLLFSLLVGMTSLVGCNNSPTGPGGSTWTQGRGLQGDNWKCGIYASGGNLLTSTYCAPCSEAAIFVSTDEGLTWRMDTVFHVHNHFVYDGLSTPLYDPAPITFISDGSILLAGVGYAYRGALYRSTDNGITWSDKGISWPETDSASSEDFNCFCRLGPNIFAGTSHGVFVSTNHGSSWNSANVGIPNIYTGRRPAVSGLVAAGNSLFATTESSGIYRSTNGGASWTEVNMTDYDFQGLASVGSEIFAAAYNELGKPSTGGVFISKDNGESWQRADADLPDHGVGAICASGSYLFAGTDTAIFASSDEGHTWMDISTGASYVGVTILWSNEKYLFANSGGGAWRYPLFLLPGTSSRTRISSFPKSKGE